MHRKSEIFFKTVRLYNFKSYKKISEVGPCHPILNTIIGPNGTGKSNFLDAILFVLGKRAVKMRFKRLKEIIYASNFKKKKHASVVLVFKKVLIQKKEKIFFSTDVLLSRQIFKDNSSHYFFNGKEISLNILSRLCQITGVSGKNDRQLIQQGEIEKISNMKQKGYSSFETGLLEYTDDTFSSSRYSRFLNSNKKTFGFYFDKSHFKKKKIILTENFGKKNIKLKKISLFSFKKKINILNQMTFLNHYRGILYIALNLKSKTKIFPYKFVYKNLKKKNKNFDKNKKKYEKIFFFFEKNLPFIRCFCVFLKKFFNILKRHNFFPKKNKKTNILVNVPYFLKFELVTNIFNKTKKRIKKILKAKVFPLLFLKYKFNYKRKFQREKKIIFLNSFGRFFKELKITCQLVNTKMENFIFFFDLLFNSLKKMRKIVNNFHLKLRLMFYRKNELLKIPQFYSMLEFQFIKIKNTNRNCLMENKALISETQNFSQKNFRVESLNFNKKKKNDKVDNMKRHIQGIIESLGSVGFVKAFLTFAFFSVLISQTNNILIDTALNSLFALEFLRENNIERTKFIIMEKIKCIEFDDDNRKEKINFLKNKIYCKKNFKKLFSHILGNLRVVKNLTEGLKLTAEREKREYIVTLDGILIERSGLITGGGISSKYFFFSKQKINLNWLGKYACVFLQFQCFKFLAKFTQTSQNFYEKKNLISHFFLEKNLDFSQSFLFFIFYFNTKIFEKKKKEKKKKANKFFMIFKKKTSEIYFKKKKKCEKKKYSLNIWAKNIFCIISIFFLEKFFFRKRFIQKKTICDFFFDQFFFDKKQKHSLIKLDFFLTVIYKKEQTNKKKKKEDFRIQTFCFFFYLFVKFNNILLSIIKIELGSLLRMVFDLRFIIDHKIYAYLADKKFSQNPRNFFFGFKKKKKRLKIEAKKVFWFSKQVEGFSLFSFFFILKKNLYKKKLILKKNIFETNTWGFKQILSYFYSTSINFFFQNENSISIFLHFSFFFFFLGKIFAIRSKFIKICRFLIKKILNATKNSHVHFQRLFEYLRYFLDFKENLRTIFPNFYQGGILEVNLIDPLDPFSEGVVLSVKPPGKTWKSVLYLSGGEKTLSSLAFVFSLQNLQKVSWYLLDEIDAALDYKNVEIISKYFNLYSSYQILIISLRNNMFMGTNHALGVYKIFSGTKTVILKNQKYLL